MRYQQARSNSAGRAPNPARPVSGAFTLDLDKIEGRSGMERLSDSGPKLVEHDLDDIINSDPVMLPITRTSLQQNVGSPESGGNRLIHNQEAHQVGHSLHQRFPAITDIFQAVNAVIAQIFSTDTNVSITALGQLGELMKDNEKVELLGPCIDHLFSMCCMQYRYVLQVYYIKVLIKIDPTNLFEDKDEGR